jgi:hypothetical protein
LFGSIGWQPGVLATHTPAWQLPVVQSASTTHALPSAHGAQASPPQSTSVSMPSFTQSWQLGEPGMIGSHIVEVGAQSPAVHVPLMQSASLLQCLARAQGGHASPPQSMSVSIPFLMPSAQVGCATPPPAPEDDDA